MEPSTEPISPHKPLEHPWAPLEPCHEPQEPHNKPLDSSHKPLEPTQGFLSLVPDCALETFKPHTTVTKCLLHHG